jgi:hypothetical protein
LIFAIVGGSALARALLEGVSMQNFTDTISASELNHVTGGLAKEPSPSGTANVGGGAKGWAISKKEKANWERYCYGDHPEDDPYGIGARERQKTCDRELHR